MAQEDTHLAHYERAPERNRHLASGNQLEHILKTPRTEDAALEPCKLSLLQMLLKSVWTGERPNADSFVPWIALVSMD
jgi:hypothetical protein